MGKSWPRFDVLLHTPRIGVRKTFDFGGVFRRNRPLRPARTCARLTFLRGRPPLGERRNATSFWQYRAPLVEEQMQASPRSRRWAIELRQQRISTGLFMHDPTI